MIHKIVIAYIDIKVVDLWFAQPRGSLALTCCCWFSKVGILVLLRNQMFVRCYINCFNCSLHKRIMGDREKKAPDR